MRSVIVRLFEPAPDAGRVGLCGIVEDVRTGARWPFHGDGELLAAVVRAAGEELTPRAGAGAKASGAGAEASGAGAEASAETCWP